MEEREIGIEILMIAATIGSAILGMWDEAAFLVFLYGTAEGLEEYTYAKTRHSIRKLLDLAPKEARVLGNICIVKPGESIPTDGIIIKGSSSINEATVTGESIPVEKKEGMRVFAATICREGARTKGQNPNLYREVWKKVFPLGSFERLAFDKTGTLTKGSPVITDIVTINGEESTMLNMAYSVERLSEHPLAKAIVKKAEEAGFKNSKADDFSAIPGYGAKATIRGETVYVGRERLFSKLGCSSQSIPQIERLKQEGKTVILIGTKETIVGVIAIRDEIRPQAKELIEKLHRMGIETVMLTGDNEVTARAIAKEIGINKVRADLKPEEKIEAVKELEQRYGVIAMVGDGVNDAPALAQATVGIAMGTAGTDAAIEAADIALMADDLMKVSYAINLGRRAKKITNQNITFSLLILALLIPSALIGIISAALAVFFHEASELLAVANGLRVAKR